MTEPATPDPGGPYLQLAFICEKMLREATGVQSYVRVIDRVTIGATGSTVPVDMPPQRLDFSLQVSVKSGDARGGHTLRIRPEKPSGEQMPTLEIGLNLEGQERGHTVNVDLRNVEFDQAGLWWFDILFGDNQTLLTRVPLRLIYQPQRVVETGSE